MRYFLPVLALASVLPIAARAWTPVPSAEFHLQVNEKFNQCLSIDGATPPFANVLVVRGNLNDYLQIFVSGLKPHLSFDLFTVERSNLDADGAPDPNFTSKFGGSFGLAWYQSDLQADDYGVARIIAPVALRSIFLDQIFGFDADKLPDGSTRLPPTNTFHVGFWFNNPADAAPCGFDVTKPTPFNGEHKAGPLAMISLPDKTTGLGPLCTSPSNDPTTGNCNP
jgi:hypothetical protein